MILNIGTFDDPAAVTPAAKFSATTHLPWVHIEGDVPHFAKRPA